MDTLKNEIKKTVLWFAETDLQNTGEISESTKEIAKVQGVKLPEPRIFTMELYQYSTDKKRQVTVHTGRLEEVRDSLTPVMYSTREFFARNKRHAESKVRKVAKAYGYQFVP